MLTMGVKHLLRKMRLLRTAYYAYMHRRALNQIPKAEREKSRQYLTEYKNKYAGQRCVIIGNGPSLTPGDLELLKTEVTFASNRIYSLYDRCSWRPTFLCAQDHAVIETIQSDLGQIWQDSELVIVAASAYGICNQDVKKIPNLVWMPLRYIPPRKNRYKFSDDVVKEVVEGLSITYSCIQLAAYMGFSEIYLLGIDHNYAIEIDKDGNIIKKDSSVKEYFDGVKEQKNKNLPQVVEMTYAYMSAEAYSRQRDFRIYNATRGGKLEVFQRREFDGVFGA